MPLLLSEAADLDRKQKELCFRICKQRERQWLLAVPVLVVIRQLCCYPCDIGCGNAQGDHSLMFIHMAPLLSNLLDFLWTQSDLIPGGGGQGWVGGGGGGGGGGQQMLLQGPP